MVMDAAVGFIVAIVKQIEQSRCGTDPTEPNPTNPKLARVREETIDKEQ